jgi:hypothetical protein
MCQMCLMQMGETYELWMNKFFIIKLWDIRFVMINMKRHIFILIFISGSNIKSNISIISNISHVDHNPQPPKPHVPTIEINQ